MGFLIAVSAGLISFIITPIVAMIANRFKFLDHPNPRKVHLKPTPLLGGLAIYFAAMITFLFFMSEVMSASPQAWSHAVAITAAATVLLVVGVLDDRGLLHSQVKLLGAIPLAAFILALGGVRVLDWPFVSYFAESPQLYLITSFALTLVWVIGFTAAFNIFDYMDGLSSGIAALAAAFFLYFSGLSGQILVGSLSAAIMGACLGFLFWNFNPAKIFMGDAGALFLGFVLAAIALKTDFGGQSASSPWLFPALILGVPIFDAAMVTISRIRRGLNPFGTPGKDHTAHRLVRLGLSERSAVGAMYAGAASLGTAAILLVDYSRGEALFAGGVVLSVSVTLIVALEFVYHRPVSKQPENTDH